MSGLPFNKYTWLVTHNSFSMVDAPSLTGAQRITFYNQEDTVTNQLRVCICLSFNFYLHKCGKQNRAVFNFYRSLVFDYFLFSLWCLIFSLEWS